MSLARILDYGAKAALTDVACCLLGLLRFASVGELVVGVQQW
jgi:hypothetical protein